jgi:hypothetical protein
MAISQYRVGQIPAAPLAITINDSLGRAVDCSIYDEFVVKMLDSDNNNIDLTGSALQTGGLRNGRFVFVWPTDRSLFTKTGDYVLEMQFLRPGAKDITTSHTIRVRDLGKVR